MIDWYYHDPAQGRVGPLRADDLRERYRNRRIARDTLLWHGGLREWQPLEAFAQELGFDEVVQDFSQPPPLPPARVGVGPAARAPGSIRTDVRASRTGVAPKRGLSGCMIALLVAAAVSVPLVGILAAIAVPAYQDYTVRAKVAQAVTQVAPLQAAMLEHASRHGNACPDNTVEGIGPADRFPAGIHVTALRIGRIDNGDCAIELTFGGLAATVDGSSLVLQHAAQADGQPWDCREGSLPARYRSSRCRAASP